MSHPLTLLLPPRLVEDTAWHPVMPSEMAKWSPTQRTLFKAFLGSPLKLWASVGHWAIWHFDLNKYTEKQRPRVRQGARARRGWPVPCFAGRAAFFFVGCGALGARARTPRRQPMSSPR